MSTQESEDLEEPKPWIISNAGRIFGVIILIMGTVKLGLTENLSFLRFYENQLGENESVYWILVFGMMLELAAIIRLSYLVTRINRRFRPLPAASSLSNLVPEISNPGLISIEASPDTTLIAESDEDKLSETRNELSDKIEVELQNGNGFETLSEPKLSNLVPEISNSGLRSIEASSDTILIAESDEDKLSETRNELPDKIEVELQNGNGFETLSEPKQENVVELQPKIIESTQSFHDISEEIVSETTDMNEVVDEEAMKANENAVGIFSKGDELVESFSTDEPKPNENIWSDVANLMQNDKSITKITGKRMRKTMTKFYK